MRYPEGGWTLGQGLSLAPEELKEISLTSPSTYVQ